MHLKKSFFICVVLLLSGLFVRAQMAATAKPGYKLSFEKVYLHTDRDIYAQGDTLWFKAYLVNGQDPSLNIYSGNLYVDLVATDSAQVINHRIIKLNNGLGNGDFALSDPTLSGRYTLRAYTNWMRNFGDSFVFNKEIIIINTSPPVALPVAKPVVKNKKPAIPAKPVAAPPLLTKPLLLRFYPEGGSMVEGISSIIAVKAEDLKGKGIPVSGAVVSSVGDTLTHFACDSLGMGMFTLMPAKGQTYRTIIKQAKRSYAFDLPSALNKGMTMQVRQSDSLLYVAIDVCNDTALGATTMPYTISVKHAGITLLNQTIHAQQMAVKIPTASLPEGLSAITVYDEHNRPNCERLVYIHHPGKAAINVSLNKSIYQPREAVTMKINAAPHSDLSVTVVDAATVDAQGDNLLTYLMLQSELKGRIEHIGRYFDTTNVNRFKQLNLLLMTQGWRDFVWRRLADEEIRVHYMTEDGITVSGYVKDEITKKPMPNLNITLFASGAKEQKMFGGHTDSTGRFIITGLPLDGIQSIKLSAVNNKGKTKGAFYVDTLSYMPVKQPEKGTLVHNLDTLPNVSKALSQKFVLVKNAKGVTNLKEVNIKAKKSVALEDGRRFMTWGEEQVFSITPKDYEFKTVTWYVLNHAKNAMPSVGNNAGVSFIIDGEKRKPIMIVNGSTWHLDQDLYYNMPLEKIKNIVIKPVISGVHLVILLYINTKENALWDNPGSTNLDVEGYYQAKSFYKPMYTDKTNTPSDLRSTIHWEPNVKTNAAGLATVSFYNADPKNKLRVIVQGLTDKGVPVAATIGYEVK